MERLASSISQYIDPNQLKQSVPEYLWFVIAVMGIGFVLYILNRLVNFLISTVQELKESNEENKRSIAVLQEMMVGVKSIIQGVKEMVADHEQDIRSLQSGKRNRGQ